MTKKAIIESEKYGKYTDLLNTLLEDKKEYTDSEVNKLIENYKKAVV